jgi:DNA-binding response OmpR family regulator
VTDVDAVRDAQAEFAFPGTPRGTETVLVVEDEAAVRRLVSSVLELSGYTVLVAAGGEEAIELSARHAGPIHLLITDVDMPSMSGRQLAQRLRTERSEARILYMSGREDVEVISHGVMPSGTIFLPKPFTPYGLTWKVREILDSTA